MYDGRWSGSSSGNGGRFEFTFLFRGDIFDPGHQYLFYPVVTRENRGEREWDSLFNPSNSIPVQPTLLQQLESTSTNSLNHTPSIRKHLNTLDLKHSSILGDSLQMRRSTTSGGKNHPESRVRRFDTSSNHQPVPRFEDVEDRWHSRES